MGPTKKGEMFVSCGEISDAFCTVLRAPLTRGGPRLVHFFFLNQIKEKKENLSWVFTLSVL